MRKTIHSIHKWAGIAVCILFLLQGTTGTLLVFKSGLWGVFSPEIERIDAAAALRLETVSQTLESEFPDDAVERITFDKKRPNFLVARLYNSEEALTVALLDGGTGQLLSSGPTSSYPVEIAERLHVSLMAGDTGHWVLLIEGLFLIVMSITGFIVWWPKKRLRAGLKIRFRAPFPLLLRDLHSVPLLFAAPFFLLSGVTGTALIAESAVINLVDVFTEVSPEPTINFTKIQKPENPATTEDAYLALQSRFPEGQFRQLRFLGNGRLIGAVMTDPNFTNPRAHHIAGLDTWTRELIVLSDATDRLPGNVFMEWILPVHTGEAWKRARAFVQPVVGILLVLASLSGPAIWLIRRRRKKILLAKAAK